MRSSIEDLLKEAGPGISSRITDALVKRGSSPDAARQQVSRARGNIQRLPSLILPKKEKFLYLDSQFGRESYWEGLRRDLKVKPGFIVCDAFVNDGLSAEEIKYFLRKCQLLGSFRKLSPFLPILVAERYTKEAFAQGRSAGVLMATPRTLFGEEVADALSSLLLTLTKAAAVAAGNPDKIYELFSTLGRVEGAAANLRGVLFEMIVGFLVREREGNSIDIGERVTDSATGQCAEMDVRRVKEDQECWVYECKGHQPTDLVTLTMAKKWIDKVGVIHSILRREKRFQGCKFGFEFWTCGNFDADSISYLRTVQSNRRKLNLGWRDGTAVREYAATTNKKSVLDTLDEHYFRNPVKTFEKRNAPVPNFDEISPESENLELEIAQKPRVR